MNIQIYKRQFGTRLNSNWGSDEVMTVMKLQIGANLRKIIKDRRLTLKEISLATGVPSTTIAEWTNNRAPKNPVQMKLVANFLEVSIHYLLFGEEDTQEPINKILKEDFFSGTFEINIRRVKINK